MRSRGTLQVRPRTDGFLGGRSASYPSAFEDLLLFVIVHFVATDSGFAACALCNGGAASHRGAGRPALPAENHVRCARTGNVFRASIAELEHVNSGEEIFTGTQKDWRNGQVHFVDSACTKVLPDCGDSATEAHVLIFGGVLGAFQCVVNSVRHKMEAGAWLAFAQNVQVSDDEIARFVGCSGGAKSTEATVVAKIKIPGRRPRGARRRSQRPSAMGLNDSCRSAPMRTDRRRKPNGSGAQRGPGRAGAKASAGSRSRYPCCLPSRRCVANRQAATARYSHVPPVDFSWCTRPSSAWRK